MNVNLKKYLWPFTGLYYFWGLKLQDFIIIIALSGSLPIYTAEKFTKNEGRFLTEAEQKTLVKKMSLIAVAISLLPTIIYFGCGIVMKLLFSPQEISTILAGEHTDKGFSEIMALNNYYLIAIVVGSALLYYLFIRLMINGTFKSQRKKYGRKSGIKS
jgi:hypothetical protein